jgi:hypothetical protein
MKAKKRAPPMRLPRTAKGRRAQFFDDPAVDQLFAIVSALTAEVSVLAERLATLERLLVASGGLRDGAIETYEPGGEEAVARTTAREALIERVFQVLEASVRR